MGGRLLCNNNNNKDTCILGSPAHQKDKKNTSQITLASDASHPWVRLTLLLPPFSGKNVHGRSRHGLRAPDGDRSIGHLHGLRAHPSGHRGRAALGGSALPQGGHLGGALSVVRSGSFRRRCFRQMNMETHSMGPSIITGFERNESRRISSAMGVMVDAHKA